MEIQKLKDSLTINEQLFQDRLLKMDSEHIQKMEELEETLETKDKELFDERERHHVELVNYDMILITRVCSNELF